MHQKIVFQKKGISLQVFDEITGDEVNLFNPNQFLGSALIPSFSQTFALYYEFIGPVG
jgi:hypothetical protein